MFAITAFTVASLVLGFWSGSVDVQAAATDPTLVKTDAGAVRGVVAGDVISFEGAPYAPPVGKLCWRAPKPAQPSQDVRTAGKFGPEGMQTAGRVVGHLGETDAARTAILDLDRADDDDFTLVTASATTSHRTMLYCGRRSRFHRPRPVRRADCGSVLPCGGAAWRRSPKPTCTSRERAGVAVAVPRCRWSGSPSDRSPRTRVAGGSLERCMMVPAHRGLPMATGALPGPRLGVQLPGSAGAAAEAHKAFGQARFEQLPDAGRLIWKALLKLDQGAGKRGKCQPRLSLRSMFVLDGNPRSTSQLIER